MHVPGDSPTTKRKKVREECDKSKLMMMDTSDDDKGITMHRSPDAPDQQKTYDNSSNRNTLCPLCEEVFTNRLSLSTHLKAEHLKERVRKDNTSL